MTNDLIAENAKLRAALEPFVYAYRATNSAYGFDVGPHFETANRVSQPYILMKHYVAAFEAMGCDSPYHKPLDGEEEE